MVNDAEVSPARTVTDGGTTTAPLLLRRMTNVLVAAAAPSVTVPVAETPLATDVGLIVRLPRLGANAVPKKFTPVTSLLVMLTGIDGGVKTKPVALGVTVNDPAGSPLKMKLPFES